MFYNHPSTSNVTLFFRTVPIVPETIGRVAEVNIAYNETVKKGTPLPNISTVDSVKRALVNAKSMATVDPAQGSVGIATGEAMRPRLVLWKPHFSKPVLPRRSICKG